METAEAWKRRKHGSGGSMIVPHDTLLLSFRFAIAHQPLIVRRVSCFHFGSRYPTSVVVCDVARVFISLLDTPPAHHRHSLPWLPPAAPAHPLPPGTKQPPRQAALTFPPMAIPPRPFLFSNAKTMQEVVTVRIRRLRYCLPPSCVCCCYMLCHVVLAGEEGNKGTGRGRRRWRGERIVG